MRSKALIIVLLIVLLAVLALSITATVDSVLVLYYNENTDIVDYIVLGQSVLKTIALLIFTLIYCKTWYYGESPGNAFADLFLFAAALIETRNFYQYTNLTGQCFIPPVLLARIQIFAVILMLLSMINAALYYNNEYSTINFLKIISVGIALALSLLLPLPISYEDIFSLLPSFWILIILCATAFVANLILMFTEPPGIGTFKHLASIVIIGGIFAIFFFNLPSSEMVGSVLLTMGYLINAILSARNAISLY